MVLSPKTFYFPCRACSSEALHTVLWAMEAVVKSACDVITEFFKQKKRKEKYTGINVRLSVAPQKYFLH